MEQHSCDVVQLGQEALCPHHLQKMHSDKNGHWGLTEAHGAYNVGYLDFPEKI